jgi:hypothetical protein
VLDPHRLQVRGIESEVCTAVLFDVGLVRVDHAVLHHAEDDRVAWVRRPGSGRNGMLDTLLAMIEAGEIAHAQTGLLAAIGEILDAGRVTGELRADVTAEDIAASLIGIFTVARPPEHDAQASRLLNILMDGLRATP